MTLEDQIETQAETIKRLWVENARLKKRCEIQQWIIDEQRKPDAPTAIERADAVFKALQGGDE